MKTIHAIFENGVFRPLEKVDLPERCEVEFELRTVKEVSSPDHLDRIHDILSRSYHTGETDTAARHNEHQP